METTKILSKLIQIPSLTSDISACSKILKLSKTILQSNEVKSKLHRIAGRSLLIWGELDLNKTEWLINSHLDVVPGSKEQFTAGIRGDKFFGRGSADTKSSCAILLANSKNWDLVAKNRHITFMLVTDEEIGGESTKKMLSKMPSLHGSIFLEPTGEKMIVQAKGIMQIKICAKGKSSHGSRPWEGVSALELLTSGISSFKIQHPSPLKETRDTTFNFSQITSGVAINQIPSEGTLWCDVRWNPKDDPKQIITVMQNTFVDCKVEVVKLESPINCPIDCKLRSSFVTTLKSLSINPISGFDHGSSDARHSTSLGIPSIVFGPKGKNLHSDDEWVSVSSIDKVEKVLDHWIKNI